MIDYKISWSPGTNAFRWSGTPALKLDPLHRGYAAHRQRDWRPGQAAYLEALRARPNRALAPNNFGFKAREPLQGLRSSLRERVEDSPLMNATQFAADLEAAFRSRWIRWCEGGTAGREART